MKPIATTASHAKIQRMAISHAVARDRSGGTTNFLLRADTIADVSVVPQPALAADAIVCTDGSPMLTTLARRLHPAQ